MANIMQQCSCNDFLPLAVLFGNDSDLQHVPGHGDRRAQILFASASFENARDEGDNSLWCQTR